MKRYIFSYIKEIHTFHVVGPRRVAGGKSPSSRGVFGASPCAPRRLSPSRTVQIPVYVPWRSAGGSGGQTRSCAAPSPKWKMQIPIGIVLHDSKWHMFSRQRYLFPQKCTISQLSIFNSYDRLLYLPPSQPACHGTVSCVSPEGQPPVAAPPGPPPRWLPPYLRQSSSPRPSCRPTSPPSCKVRWYDGGGVFCLMSRQQLRAVLLKHLCTGGRHFQIRGPINGFGIAKEVTMTVSFLKVPSSHPISI